MCSFFLIPNLFLQKRYELSEHKATLENCIKKIQVEKLIKNMKENKSIRNYVYCIPMGM